MRIWLILFKKLMASKKKYKYESHRNVGSCTSFILAYARNSLMFNKTFTTLILSFKNCDFGFNFNFTQEVISNKTLMI